MQYICKQMRKRFFIRVYLKANTYSRGDGDALLAILKATGTGTMAFKNLFFCLFSSVRVQFLLFPSPKI